MFGTVLTLLTTLMQVYVFARVSSLPAFRGRRARSFLWGCGGAFWLLFLLARTVDHGARGWGGALLETVGMDWMAVLFLCATATLAGDVVTGFGLWIRKGRSAVRTAALVAGGLLSALALVQGFRPPAIVEYAVRLRDLPRSLDGTTLAVVSDTHLGAQLGAHWFARRVDQILSFHPDAILLAGDIAEGHGHLESDLLPQMRRLRAPLGVWAVTGNHESHGAGSGLSLLTEAGIPVLHDRWVELAPGLVLAGVDDLGRRRRRGEDAEVITRALAGRAPGGAVLLSHTPWRAEEAAAAGAGLMLCGHTHGGQIWPFGYLVAREYPLLAGRYDVAGMTVLVSRGAGTWGPRMRLWRRGEILKVTLRTP